MRDSPVGIPRLIPQKLAHVAHEPRLDLLVEDDAVEAAREARRLLTPRLQAVGRRVDDDARMVARGVCELSGGEEVVNDALVLGEGAAEGRAEGSGGANRGAG